MEAEKHPFAPFIPSGARTLIIGTFPTARQHRRFAFYYPGAGNRFWHIMSDIFGVPFLFTWTATPLTESNALQAVDERKQFLTAQGIGITDMIETCERKHNSSRDSDLVPIQCRDIVRLLDNHPAINRLVVTSRGGTNGAFRLLTEHLEEQHIPFAQTPYKVNRLLRATLAYPQGRMIEIFVPYSPSLRVYNAYGRAYMTRMYKESLLDFLSLGRPSIERD